MTAEVSAIDLPAFEKLGIPVRLSRIEKELQALFDGDVDPSSSDAVSGVARASLINLALYTEEVTSLEEEADKLAQLTHRAACRSILVCADRNSPRSEARAWIQVHCQLDRSGRKTVCSEQISFYLTGRVPGLLQNTVFAHLDSDLPLAFWWRGELSEAFEATLYSCVDRLIFDSETWRKPAESVAKVLQAQRSVASPFVMHDFAFTRIHWIRHAVADAFDRPAVSTLLTHLSRVSIRYAEGFKMSALYLAAWLSDRSGARIEGVAADSAESEEAYRMFPSHAMFSEGFDLTVGKMDPERVGTVEVDFDLGDVRVEIGRCQTRQFLRTRIYHLGEEVDEDWLPANTPTDVSLVTEILTRAGRNRTHAQVVPKLLDLLSCDAG